MRELIKDIDLTDSYILGWKHLENRFILYTEVLLKKNHPKWEKFNTKTEFGCYKLATFTFQGIKSLVGIETDSVIPTWNENLNEYYDYGEINRFRIKNNIAMILLNTKTIEIEFSNMNLEVLDSPHFV